MDSNGNQRKKTGRLAKQDNDEGMGPPTQVNENIEVSGLAIPSTTDERESANNVPAAECRRSSRKKIIKFDVRDLLNKNRKPHKIQIEARIDSNAPSTSKTSTTTSGELILATPLSMSVDLLSKQKTFLEKSAIFRRYSISQEPKPPPPPLPLPPSLLGKGGEGKDANLSGGSASRRLSRTQEFFSNVMIKPKQTTSLIVAQMESSAPSVIAKRKILTKYIDTEIETSESTETTTVQKKRGRPLKTKIKTSEDTPLTTSSIDDPKPKKLTPDKATNWKEYKACLAQQTGAIEDINKQTKSEVLSQNTSPTHTTDDLMLSSSSHNSDIEDFPKEQNESKSLSDHMKIKELNLLSKISIDEINSKNSIQQQDDKTKVDVPLSREISLTDSLSIEDEKINVERQSKLEDSLQSNQEDLKETEKNIVKDNENQMETIKKTEKQKVPEKLDEVKDSKEISTSEKEIKANNDKKSQKDNNSLEDEKEASSSQSNINKETKNKRQINKNESLQKINESIENITSIALADSAQELQDLNASESLQEQTFGKKDQTNNKSLHIEENISKNNKEKSIDGNSHSKKEVKESLEKISSTEDLLPKENEQQNTDNKNDAPQDKIDSNETKSSKEVTNTRKSRSSNKSPPEKEHNEQNEKQNTDNTTDAEQDKNDMKDTKSKDITNTRKSRSKNNKSQQEQINSKRNLNKMEDLLSKEKDSKSSPSNRRSHSKYNSPQEKIDLQSIKKHDDETKTDVVLSKEIELKDLDSTDYERQPNTRSDLVCKEKEKNIQLDDVLPTASKSEVDLFTEKIDSIPKQDENTSLLKETKLKDLESIESKSDQSCNEKKNKQLSNILKDDALPADSNSEVGPTTEKIMKNTRSQLNTRSDQSCNEKGSMQLSNILQDDTLPTDSNSEVEEMMKNTRSISKMKVSLPEEIASNILETPKETKTTKIGNSKQNKKVSSKQKMKEFTKEIEDNNVPQQMSEENISKDNNVPQQISEENISKDNNVPQQTSEENLSKEKISETTPTNKRKLNKKATVDHTKKEDTENPIEEAANENKQLSNFEEKLQEAFEKEQDKKHITTNKKTPRNKRNLNKLEESLQHAEYKNDSSTSKKSNKDKTKTTTMNITDDSNTDNKIILSAEEFENIERTNLKTPEPSSNPTQNEQENVPNLKIPTNDDKQEALSLSQPSTPSEKKSLTFSRTSSSSESENQSERSSYSSTTTSSSSTSTRSYKSGDKLKVSIKRMSLPLSPSSSSSSQISASDEPNSPGLSLNDDIKKKLPKAKRSKRLQKKQDTAENIDDCFQKITTDKEDEIQNSLKNLEKNDDDKIEEIEVKETTINENLAVTQNTQNILETNKPASNELEKEEIKSVGIEELDKISTELLTTNDPIDSIKPTTSKGKIIKNNSTIIKRKSLRNRKENDSTDKEQETKESEEDTKATFKEITLQENKLLRNLNENVIEDKAYKETKEIVSEVKEKQQKNQETITQTKERADEKDVQQQQEQEIAQKCDKTESDGQEEKLTESKQKQKKKLKEKTLSLNKQQKKRKAKDEQSCHQDQLENQSCHQDQLENQEEKIQLEKQETKPLEKININETPVVQGEETKMELKAKAKAVNKDEKPIIDSTSSSEDKAINKAVKEVKEKGSQKSSTKKTKQIVKEIIDSTGLSENKTTIKAEENRLIKEVDEKESQKSSIEKTKEIVEEIIDSTCSSKDKTTIKATENIITKEVEEKESQKSSSEKTKEIFEEIDELKKNESSMVKTKIESPKRSKSLKDKSSAASDSANNVSGKSDISLTDSKQNETSKRTTKRSRTGIEKTKSSKNVANTDKQNPEKEFSKIYSKKEIPLVKAVTEKDSNESSSTKNIDKDLANIDKQNPKMEFPEMCCKELIPLVKAEESFINVTEKLSHESSSTQNIEELSLVKNIETSLMELKETNEIDINEINEESFNSANTNIGTSTPLASKPDLERPTSSKRKSLRNQKDKNYDIEISKTDGNSLAKQSQEQNKQIEANPQTKEIIEEPVFTENIQDIPENKLDILTSNVIVEEPVKVSKRKGRKSRFKNLHSPELESETESSTGKQTPIEITVLPEKQEEPVDIENAKKDIVTLGNKSENEAELVKINKTEILTISKEDPIKDDEVLKNIEIKENKDLKQLNIEEESSKKPDLILESPSVVDNSMKPFIMQTAAPESYLMQNVSIETNTLLDILRTVQSNTAAAALEANNKKPENYDENVPKSQLDLPSTSQDINLISLKSLRKFEIDSNTNSPTRCDTISPLTMKKVAISPTRSDSNSPLTFKKVGLSPTRSDTSSPLTLKKVTRRYERRSRRGEDSAHKTLEETFAEIAAQSSQAVLAAKSFDTNEEIPVGEIKEKDDELTLQHEVPIVAELVEEVKLTTEIPEDINKSETEVLIKDIENASENIEEKINDKQKVSEVLENFESIKSNKSEDVALEKSDSNIPEKDLEIQIADKVTPVNTPTRRGRKPKNRESDIKNITKAKKVEKSTLLDDKDLAQELVLPTTKDSEIKNISKAKKVIEKSNLLGDKNDCQEFVLSISKDKEESTDSSLKEDKDASHDPQEIAKEKVSSAENPLKNIEQEETETKLEDDLKPYEDEVKQQDSLKEISSLTQSLETKVQDDIKISKKSTKKRDSSKELPSTSADFDNLAKEDEIRTPKQAVKKRDSSLTKSESKSVGKKSSKKTKNNEEELSVAPKEENLPKTSTPPPKRGRKPKNQQEALQTNTSLKKKNKKEFPSENDDVEILSEKRKDLESESESLNSSLDKSMDEKMAKKKRQKKLKEAFEAALTEDLNKSADITNINSPCASSTTSFGLTLLSKSPPPERIDDSLLSNDIRAACITPVEEDPDPLKDIEKFIADGVNLLKKDYKLDEDSVGDVITSTTIKTNENEVMPLTTTIEEDKPIYNTFETPADTPINTPSVSPPPKSPTSIESSTPDENSGVRRSHRIKLITQTPKALVGRGLVRDKERFSIKDDVETKSHYTLDDHLLDLAEVEAKNAKFLKEMEERLSNFQVIKENEYLCERVISREAKKMICDCFLTQEEEERGELGCGEDCLNRLLMIECGPECNVKERCTNKRFQKLLCSPCRVFRTEKKGFGIMADIEILPGEFIMEYVGEVIDTDIFEQRRIMYSQDKNRHYYFMALRSDAIIDATIQGNISRFINHSCDPNAETQKWTVNGELRIGFFSRKSIMPGEEITFNYQYQRYGREAQRCYCESSNCRGWIGQEPTSDEGEQIDDDDYEESEDDEEEEQDTSNLLVHDEDEDSDASVTDPEEVQKKLEMAAAQAEVELAPIHISEDKETDKDNLQLENKENDDAVKSETEEEEDSKSKFKKLLSKMAEKVAAKQKQNKRQQKLHRKKKSKESSADLTNKLRFSEDPDIEDEVEFLRECGLKNQSDTLRLSRLMVRAKLVQTRLNLLEILRIGDLPCRRLFLDYHGLRLVHGWMSEDAGNMQIRLALLQTLDTLPIANKTVLTDSKVMQMVRSWCGSNTSLSPNEDSSSSNSNQQDNSLQLNTHIEEATDLQELHKLALKLITTWEGLPEIFRIPKKERIEQMKEHEREADRQYAANAETEENKTSTDRYRRNRFGFKTSTFSTAAPSNRFTKPNNGNPLRSLNIKNESVTNLSKAQRREMFAAKVARDEAEKRMIEERREFETKCRFFGLDPKKIRPQDVPFCVNPSTGQWYSVERKPIITPPSYTHVQVPVKPKSTDPNDYKLPAACNSLNAQWKFAITPQGKIYYYHIKYRIPQWEPPTATQLQQSEMEADDDDSESELTNTTGDDSSEDDDEILIGMDAVQLRAYIDRKVESRRQKRYQRLVEQRAISPRREEDRVYNQIEVRKYKENKEKIRKRKEEIRRKRTEALRQSSLNMCTLGSVMDTTGLKLQTESDEELGVLPIQDYLLSSDEDVDLKTDVNSALMDKIVEGDKIVDELDALTSKRQLKRPLPPHRDLNEPSTSSVAASLAIENKEYKKRKLEKKDKKKPKDQDAKYRKNKEKFRCEIAGIIVHYLKPYRRESCPKGHIQSNDDFNHLARKLTHFVMIKELKYCEAVGQTLVVTESVKNKSREFIKKYMAKYGDVYIKPNNDPDFKDIPFTL